MNPATPVSPDLLAILRCPESLQSLRLADDAVFARFHEQAQHGNLKNLQGSPIGPDFDTILIREDGKRGYLVRDGIPVMLIDEALAL